MSLHLVNFCLHHPQFLQFCLMKLHLLFQSEQKHVHKFLQHFLTYELLLHVLQALEPWGPFLTSTNFKFRQLKVVRIKLYLTILKIILNHRALVSGLLYTKYNIIFMFMLNVTCISVSFFRNDETSLFILEFSLVVSSNVSNFSLNFFVSSLSCFMPIRKENTILH